MYKLQWDNEFRRWILSEKSCHMLIHSFFGAVGLPGLMSARQKQNFPLHACVSLYMIFLFPYSQNIYDGHCHN